MAQRPPPPPPAVDDGPEQCTGERAGWCYACLCRDAAEYAARQRQADGRRGVLGVRFNPASWRPATRA